MRDALRLIISMLSLQAWTDGRRVATSVTEVASNQSGHSMWVKSMEWLTSPHCRISCSLFSECDKNGWFHHSYHSMEMSCCLRKVSANICSVRALSSQKFKLRFDVVGLATLICTINNLLFLFDNIVIEFLQAVITIKIWKCGVDQAGNALEPRIEVSTFHEQANAGTSRYWRWKQLSRRR